MGHGSWFSQFFGSFYQTVVGWMHYMGWPFNDEGQTWGLVGNTYDIAHAEGHGAQALIHVALVFVILVIISLVTFSKIKDTNAALIPEDRLTLRTFVEVFVGVCYSMMADIMGKKPARYFLPLIGTCAFLILFCNGFALVPGFLPATSSMSVTLACGGIIFFATHVYGVKEHGLGHFKHFFGPIIAWYALPLMLLMLVIELVSHFVRPLSLAIRLMANMFADHTVLGIFMGLGVLVGTGGFLVPVPVLLLGSLVVVVQTLVFCLLATVYIAMAIEQAEDH